MTRDGGDAARRDADALDDDEEEEDARATTTTTTTTTMTMGNDNAKDDDGRDADDGDADAARAVEGLLKRRRDDDGEVEDDGEDGEDGVEDMDADDGEDDDGEDGEGRGASGADAARAGGDEFDDQLLLPRHTKVRFVRVRSRAQGVCVFCARVFARVCGVLSALDGVRGARRGEARRRARTRDSIATARVVLTV